MPPSTALGRILVARHFGRPTQLVGSLLAMIVVTSNGISCLHVRMLQAFKTLSAMLNVRYFFAIRLNEIGVVHSAKVSQLF